MQTKERVMNQVKIYLLDDFGKYKFHKEINKADVASYCAKNGIMVDSHQDNRYYCFVI